MVAVYTIYDDRSADEESGNLGYAPETLDGDFRTAFPVGVEFDPGVKAAFMEDGTLLQQSAAYQGVLVDMSGLPKRIRWGGGKRDLGDLRMTASHFLMSKRMRDAIETLEPNVHQFRPTELIWKDGSHAADFFWFNPCNRVDGMDREHTTHDFNEKIGKWIFGGGGQKYVINLAQTAGKHLWVDNRLLSDSVFVSGEFKKIADEAEILGVGFNRFDVV